MISDQEYDRPMIGINAHLLTGQQSYRRAGIHNYIAQLLRHMALLDSPYQFTVYCNSAQALGNARMKLVSTPLPAGHPMGRILWEQLVWPISAWRRKLDLLHSMAFVAPYASTSPSVVTVYDLSFIHHPEQFPRLRRVYLAGQTRRSCRSARRVVTISESGRNDVHRQFGVPLERIDVVSPGVGEFYHPRPAAVVEDFRRQKALPERYALHVGTLQPRKNIPLLIDAFAALADDGLALVLVGGKGWMYDEIFERVQALGLEKRVRFTGYVPDDELPLWYNAASALVFPSYYEGFGMPVLEAMACGTPVIAAQTSAIPEAAGNAALLFDPQDKKALREQIAAVLDDPSLAAKMRQKGLTQAARYSWPRAAQAMLDVYRRALSEL
ncbi:MAG: glycosyltransferase family 1 protein [Chloroflexota bacterium]|jgi:glycosyltransferase involved in cell wall biosynthesis